MYQTLTRKHCTYKSQSAQSVSFIKHTSEIKFCSMKPKSLVLLGPSLLSFKGKKSVQEASAEVWVVRLEVLRVEKSNIGKKELSIF